MERNTLKGQQGDAINTTLATQQATPPSLMLKRLRNLSLPLFAATSSKQTINTYNEKAILHNRLINTI